MNLPIALAIFFIGFVWGVISLVMFTIFLGKRALDRKKKELTESTADGKPSLEERMKRYKDITEEQLGMMSNGEGPQKNGMDGKFKNSVNRTIKSLEEEKTSILKSIIVDGHDPDISVLDPLDGTVTRMKLSQYMLESGITTPPKEEPLKSKQFGKFVLYKGGKDDGNGNTTH